MIVICAVFFFSVRTMYLLLTSGRVRKKNFYHVFVISSITLLFPVLACFVLLCTSISVVVCVFDLLFILRA